MHGNDNGRQGFTLVEIMIVIAIVALLGALAIPGYVHYTAESRKNLCISNLKQIHAAIETWAVERKKGPSASVEFNDISPFFSRAVVCPSGGVSFDDSYSITTVSADAHCMKVPQAHVWMSESLEVAGSGK